MSVKGIPLSTFMEALLCDECQEEMIWDRMELTSNPPQYRHNCPRCGRQETIYNHHYPRIRQERVS